MFWFETLRHRTTVLAFFVSFRKLILSISPATKLRKRKQHSFHFFSLISHLSFIRFPQETVLDSITNVQNNPHAIDQLRHTHPKVGVCATALQRTPQATFSSVWFDRPTKDANWRQCNHKEKPLCPLSDERLRCKEAFLSALIDAQGDVSQAMQAEQPISKLSTLRSVSTHTQTPTSHRDGK